MPNQYTAHPRHAVLTCAYCGSTFRLKLSAVGSRGQGKFCSRACTVAARSQQVDHICETCAAPFRGLPKRMFCGPSCRKQQRRVPLAVRFPRFVERTEGCWHWTGMKNADGYGLISRGGLNGGAVGAHRVAYELASGETLTTDEDVLHTCDTPDCVRNDEPGTYEVQGVVLPRFGHLVRGTHGDNQADKMSKGRQAKGDRIWVRLYPERTHRGERSSRAKLTWDAVADIRRRYAEGSATQLALAAEYGVVNSLICEIIAGKRWNPRE